MPENRPIYTGAPLCLQKHETNTISSFRMTLIISFIVINILMKWSHDLKPETFQSLIFELIVKTTV